MKDIILTIMKCKRCDHKWIPRKTDMPVSCPKCRSPYWNKKRKHKKVRVSK